MGSFIKAIQGFSGEIFSRSLDRIKIAEYTLMLSPEDDCTVCYIYKGQSYSSQKRIKSLMERLVERESIVKCIMEANTIGISPEYSVIKEIKEIVGSIF